MLNIKLLNLITVNIKIENDFLLKNLLESSLGLLRYNAILQSC